jgi:hypothetical protein
MDNNDQQLSSNPFWVNLKASKPFAILVWIISLILGSISLYVYLSTAKLPSPDSAGETFVYNLIFFPVFIVALGFGIVSFFGLIFIWHFSKNYARVHRIMLVAPIGLVLSPVSLQVLLIILKIIFGIVFVTLGVLYMYIRLIFEWPF